MRNCKKLMAVLTAALMLCGCTNNTPSSQTETDSTAETVSEVNSTAETTAESSVPEQGAASHEAATVDPGASGEEGESAQNPGGGVDLVSEKYSDNSLIFDLNGKYCGVSELPFSVQTFQPDIDPEELPFLKACGGKLFLRKVVTYGENAGSNEPGGDVQWYVYSYDLKSGEMTEICASQDFADSGEDVGFPLYIDNTYVLLFSGTDSITAVNHTTGKTVFTLRNDTENYTYNFLSSLIVNDQLYFDGTYYIPEFDKEIPVIFRAYLSNGNMEILCSGMFGPQYGVANVCFQIEMPSAEAEIYTNLRGEIFAGYGSTIFTDTYFPIEYDNLYDKHLGSRDKIRWIDKLNNYHEIGTTGFNYELDIYYNSNNAAHITRDGIYLLELARYEQENSAFWYLIGRYDEETGENTAALIENDGDDYVFVENTAIYIVDPDTLETTVLSMPE